MSHFQTRRTDDGSLQVFDVLRRRYVALTPEEQVRQRFVQYLIEQRGYPAALMANEVVVRLNGMAKRCDTLVSDRQGRARAIIEYKAPTVTITQKVFDQVSHYNMVMHVDYLIVSNGRQTYCARMDYEARRSIFLPDIPTFDEMITPPQSSPQWEGNLMLH